MNTETTATQTTTNTTNVFHQMRVSQLNGFDFSQLSEEQVKTIYYMIQKWDAEATEANAAKGN